MLVLDKENFSDILSISVDDWLHEMLVFSQSNLA